MNLQMDLRLLSRVSTERNSTIDAGTCEFIRSVFNCNYYKDKLEAVIASKPS